MEASILSTAEVWALLGQLCQEAWDDLLVPLQLLLTWAAKQVMLLNDLMFSVVFFIPPPDILGLGHRS